MSEHHDEDASEQVEDDGQAVTPERDLPGDEQVDNSEHDLDPPQTAPEPTSTDPGKDTTPSGSADPELGNTLIETENS